MRRLVSGALSICLAAAAASSGAADLQTVRATLLRIDNAWAHAAAAKDVERTLSFWADDASVVPPGQPAVVGKEAIRRYVTEAFAIPGFSINWKTSDFSVSASGDVAYGMATNTTTFNDPQGKLITEHGRGVTVWRKGPGGKWKCVVDIWNAAPATPPASK